MSVVASRDLRNHTAEVLRRVARGDRVTVTVNGMPVAEIGPVRAWRRPSLTRRDLATLLADRAADAGLRADLEALVSETTHELS